MVALEAVLREHGFDPIAPAVGNFLFVDVGEDAAALDQRCCGAASSSGRWGRSVRPPHCASLPARPRRSRSSPKQLGRGLLEGLTKPSGRSGYRSAARARGALVPMRTTLKRGVGRGATLNGNGRAAVPPAPLGPVTVYHQPPPARAERPVARARDPRLVGARARRAGRRHRRGRVPLPPRVRRGGRAEDGRGEEGAREARPRAARRARDGARDRLRPPGGRGQEHAVPLGHADARARRPRREDDLAALVPARPERRDPLPRPLAVRGEDQRRVRDVRRRPGSLETVRDLTGVPINYIITVNFRGLPAARRQARRRLDRRRPALLQRPRRPERLREDQPPARATST